MENKNENDFSAGQSKQETDSELSLKKTYILSVSILMSSVIVAGAWLFTTDSKTVPQRNIDSTAVSQEQQPLSELEESVLPLGGVELPVVWGDLGEKLVSVGVIDANKFEAIYQQRGQFSEEYRKLLLDGGNGKLTINSSNSGYLLNLFWALGLASKNSILEKGEMSDPSYGGAGRFASTGGWTASVGNAMDHFSRHKFFNLTDEQQALVDKVSRGIFRPCCGNSTHFPDCNHGMAMLGLLELMASQDVSEQDMWKTALAVNSYWFPENYLTIASYMKSKGVDWKDVNPQEILGSAYSSNQGYVRISSQVTTPQLQQGGGNGCGLDAGSEQTVSQQRRPQVGCSL